MKINKIYTGDTIDVLKTLPDKSINCCVTSPPYWGLRDYGKDDQIGLEKTPDLFVSKLVEVFQQVKRVLKDDGTLWLNLGDSYSRVGGPQPEQSVRKNTEHVVDAFKGSSKGVVGLKPKDLIGIPWMVAFALRTDGWYLRQDIIWHKPNPMPESVKDRCTKSHEYIFLLSKSPKYHYDHEAIKEPARNWGTRDRSKMRNGTTDPKLKHHGLTGKPDEENPMKNKRDVWTVTTRSFKGAHFATFPPDLITPCILAGCPEGGTVLDPFSGAGTTALVSKMNKRKYVGIELNPEYVELSENRLIDYDKSQDPFYNFK